MRVIGGVGSDFHLILLRNAEVQMRNVFTFNFRHAACRSHFINP
jgi:hypothetical protein